jgi:hypothetical protein
MAGPEFQAIPPEQQRELMRLQEQQQASPPPVVLVPSTRGAVPHVADSENEDQSLLYQEQGGRQDPGGQRQSSETEETEQDAGSDHGADAQGPRDGTGENRSARQEAAVKARERVDEDLAIVAAGLEDLSPYWDELATVANLPSGFLDYLRDAVHQTRDDVDELVAAGAGQSSAKALETMTTMAAIQDGVAEMQAGAENAGTAGGNSIAPASQALATPVSKTLAWIMKALNRAAKWLWTLISRLVTPTGWSLSGGIGMPGLANASISVTFG